MQQRHADRPEISVIAAISGASCLASALDAVFAQTCSDFETIVVNDRAPEAPAASPELAPDTSRVRYLQLGAHRGVAAARNAAIVGSTGRYLAFVDPDDRWRPDFLRSQLAWLHANPSYALACADVTTPSAMLPAATRQGGAQAHGDVSLLDLISHSPVVLSTVLIRRDAIVSAGMFDEGLRRGQDFDLWLRLAARGAKLSHQPVALVERRPRPEGSGDEGVDDIERALSVLERFGHRHVLDAPTRTALRIRTMQLVDRLEIEQGKRRILEGNFAAARYHLAAARQRPFTLRLALLALQIAPRLVRAVYTRARPSSGASSPALISSR